MLRARVLLARDPRVIQPAWRELRARLSPFVARRVRGAADVDDVVQDALLRMQRGLAGLHEPARVTPWAYQVARSAIAEHRRSRARHPLATDDRGRDEACAEGEDEDEAAFTTALAGVAAALVDGLPEPYREALRLTELGGLTQREAAARLGISLSGMKSRVQRGRRLLREALEARCELAIDARRRVIGCSPRSEPQVTAACAPACAPLACAP